MLFYTKRSSGEPRKLLAALLVDPIPSHQVRYRVWNCHGRGREFESRRPRHIFQTLAESRAFRRGKKKEQ